MLRESIGDNRFTFDGSTQELDTRIPLAAELVNYARAVCAPDPAEIAHRREAILNAAGGVTVVDAAGIIADFQGLTRIVDATGTELEDRFRLD